MTQRTGGVDEHHEIEVPEVASRSEQDLLRGVHREISGEPWRLVLCRVDQAGADQSCATWSSFTAVDRREDRHREREVRQSPPEQRGAGEHQIDHRGDGAQRAEAEGESDQLALGG